MPRASWLQTSFNAGEWSPLVYGRVDVPKRKNALTLCRNYVPTVQGPITRRPGTAYVAQAPDNTNIRLQRFEFNNQQSYILEFTPNLIRFYTQGGLLLNGGSPYTVATTYSASDLWGLAFTQSADVLYIAHANHPPATLSRLGATNWVLANLAFQDGPYLPRNVTGTLLSCTSAVSGASATVTASSTTGINGGNGFQSSDVGRVMRIGNETSGAAMAYVWATITAVTNSTTAQVTINTLPPS